MNQGDQEQARARAKAQNDSAEYKVSVEEKGARL